MTSLTHFGTHAFSGPLNLMFQKKPKTVDEIKKDK